MPIKYEEHYIENAAGSGKKRAFVQLKTDKARTPDELATEIAHSSTLTKADVKAVLTELCHVAVDDLSAGRRFYLPEIGYLSLAVGNTPVDKLPKGKITGKDIYLRNINFQPEGNFLRQVRERVKFAKSDQSSVSVSYTEDKLWPMLEAYLRENAQITRRVMCAQFGLTDYVAKRWLSRFTADGRLTKTTFGRQFLYSLSEG